MTGKAQRTVGMISAVAAWIDTVGPNRRSRSIARSAAFNSRAGISHMLLGESLIRYRVAGNASNTLVLATIPPVTIELYDELIEQLQNDFKVVVFELPGFGFSLPRTGHRFDFTASNDVVATFLQRLDLGPYVLAFPCVSGFGAIDIAARFPDLVSGVVLIQVPAWSEEIKWKHGRDPRGILCTPIIGQLALQALKRRRAPVWFDAAVGKRERLPQFLAATDEAFAGGACFCLASAFQRYLTDTGPSLPTIGQPSLVIWGEADRSHRRSDKSSTRLYSPNAEDVRISTAGHFSGVGRTRALRLRGEEMVAGKRAARGHHRSVKRARVRSAGANSIGRFTQAGGFTEFPIPTASSYPEYIVSGPDGALWFTERNGSKIGRAVPH